jgi:amino acid transporter
MSKVDSSKDHSGGLAKASVTPLEVGAQSLANVAPSAVIAFAPAMMAASAGNGAWLSFLIAMIGTLAVGYCISIFARRRAGAGSLYTLARPAIGATGSFITGWALLIGAIGAAGGSLAGLSFFLAKAFGNVGIHAFDGMGGQMLLDVILVLTSAYITMVGVSIAARIAVTFETISISLIVISLIVLYFKAGHIVDHAQLTLKGLSLTGVTYAVVLGILGFVGFESAAALGEEAQDRFKAIPRAIMGSALFTGVLYIFATYSQVALFHGGAAALAKSGAPMDDLLSQHGLSGVQGFINVGFAASFMAVVIACITVAARLLFTMSHEGLLPAKLGKTHPKHRTPTIAIYAVLPFVAVPTLVVTAYHTAPLLVTTYIDTIGVFGYMLSYLLVCVAAPILMRTASAKAKTYAFVFGTVGIAVMAYVFYRNILPVPPSPFNVLPYIFLGGMVIGIAGYVVLKVKDPERALRAGTFADVADVGDVTQ